jgi:hypothetical protein
MVSPSETERPVTEAPSATSLTLPIGRAQTISLVLLVPFAAASLLPHWLLWGAPAGDLIPAWVLLAIFASIPVHEGLHGVGYRQAGAARSSITFGVNWRALAPYAHCRAPLRASGYRWAVALPGLVLGGAPLLLGLASGSWAITMLAFANLAAAAGDALLYGMLWRVAPRAWVLDHPSEMGAVVLGQPGADSPPAAPE